MPTVNVWEMARTLATYKKDQYDPPGADNAREFLDACNGKEKFGSEVEVSIDESGTWTLTILNHDEDYANRLLVVKVTTWGHVTVRRERTHDNISDSRTVGF